MRRGDFRRPAPGPRPPAPVVAAIIAVALACACSAPRRVVITSSGAHVVEHLLDTRRADPDRNVTVFELDRDEHTSRHLVWVRDREQPHVHPANDIIVTILRGHGTIWLDGEAVAMSEGDEAVVDAGTPHYFVNEGSEPAAAFVVYAPPSDGSPPQPVAP